MSNTLKSMVVLGAPTPGARERAFIVAMKNANIIRTLRRERGLSQAALAAAIGWERGTIAAVENGHDRPGTELVQALATFFGTTTDQILGREGAKQPAAAQTDEEAELLARFREASADAKAATLMSLRAMTRSRQ
jgi:transcriptional regulator with XRE-family HTH domain